MTAPQKLADALAILAAFDLPKAQQNERSALCFLAICDMTPDKGWK
jgi:adenine-specific DNA-methyltransferase